MLFVASSIQIYRMSCFVCKSVDSSFLAAFFDVIGSLSLCAMTFIAALFVTMGFMKWCDGIMIRFQSCELSAGNPIDKHDGIDTAGFYFEMGIAQFAIWGSWATWVGLTVLSFLKLCRYHQLENIRVSMFRERQKLIGEMASSLERDWDVQRSKPGDREDLSRAPEIESWILHFFIVPKLFIFHSMALTIPSNCLFPRFLP